MRPRQSAATFDGTDDMYMGVAGYTSNQFIGALDLERVGHLGASHSGNRTKDGSVVQSEIINSGMQAGDTMMIFLVYDGLLSIKDGHCEVFE